MWLTVKRVTNLESDCKSVQLLRTRFNPDLIYLPCTTDVQTVVFVTVVQRQPAGLYTCSVLQWYKEQLSQEQISNGYKSIISKWATRTSSFHMCSASLW